MDKWLRNKTIMQIVALLLGTLLWVVVHVEQQPGTPGNVNPVIDNHTMIYSDVQIEVAGIDLEQYHIRSIEPAYVNVTVSGKSSDLRNINAGVSNHAIVLDLTGFKSGIHNQVPLQARGYPEGVEVTIDPPAVSVAIESIGHKEVPVEVIVQGEPAEGFRAGEAIVQPNRVNVSVPESQIDEIVKVRAVVDISNATEAVVTERKLAAINRQGEEVDVTITPSVAEISIPVTSPFKTIPLQMKFSGEVPDGLAIADFYQSIDEVTVYGSEAVIEQYDFYGGITINASAFNRAQTYTYTYNIPLQSNLHQVLPETVDVQIRVVESELKTFEDFPVMLIGQNEEVHTEITLPEQGVFDLVLEGAPELLRNVRADNVQALIDVSNLPPGEYTREIQLILPRFIKYGGDPAALEAKVVISTNAEEDEDVPADGEPDSETEPADSADSNEDMPSGDSNDQVDGSPADNEQPDESSDEEGGNDELTDESDDSPVQ